MSGLESIAIAAEQLQHKKKETAAANSEPPLPTTGGVSKVVTGNGVKNEELTLDYFLNKQLEQDDRPPPPPPPDPDQILKVLDGDVILGRGGVTNHHKGNVRYRMLVKKYQKLYLQAKRRDKPRIAMLIVDSIRREGGRFLKCNPLTKNWFDVGNTKAREKTSQALREGAPDIRDGLLGKSKKKKPARVPKTQVVKSDMMHNLMHAAGLVSPTSSSSTLASDVVVKQPV